MVEPRGEALKRELWLIERSFCRRITRRGANSRQRAMRTRSTNPECRGVFDTQRRWSPRFGGEDLHCSFRPKPQCGVRAGIPAALRVTDAGASLRATPL